MLCAVHLILNKLGGKAYTNRVIAGEPKKSKVTPQKSSITQDYPGSNYIREKKKKEIKNPGTSSLKFSALRGSQGSWQSSSKTENLKHGTYYHTPEEVPLL